MTARRTLTLTLLLALVLAPLPAAADPEVSGMDLPFWPNDVAVDAAGNVYLAGCCTENENSALVQKRSPDGAVLWTVELGGSDYDAATAITVDNEANVWVGGHTWSSDFPVTQGAWDTTLGGDIDAWVVRLSAEDGNFAWGTFIGGTGYEVLADLDWGPSDSVVAVGNTASCDFRVSSSAFDRSFNDGECNGFGGDIFVVRLTSSGSSVVYASYLGGSEADIASGVAVSRSSGTAMVAGWTTSTNYPTTSGAHKRLLEAGVDGFVTKLSGSGSSLSFSTLLGGDGMDIITGVARDAVGDAFVVGNTDSTDLPTTPGAFQTRFGGGDRCGHEEWHEGMEEPVWVAEPCTDVFVARVNDGGASLDYLTYIGTEGLDEAWGIAIDARGYAYVAGTTDDSFTFPVIDPRVWTDSSRPSFTLAVTPNGKALAYSQLLAGELSPNAVAAMADGTSVHVGLPLNFVDAGYMVRVGPPSAGLVIEPRGGNEFWVETFVGGARGGEVTKVEARDENTPWTTLSKSPWGFYAGEVHVDTGVVQIRATASSGLVETACFLWDNEMPTPPTRTECPQPPPQPVSFTHGGGNEWWVEVKVEPMPSSVQAMDTGGSWKSLAFKSWGEWAASFHIEPGHEVRFRATFPNGTTVESCWFSHPGGTPRDCGGTIPPGNFDATFSNVRGNEWWVETDVTVTGGTLAGVDARVNGGSWIALEKKSWGSWAKSFHAEGTVEFRARSTDGAVDLSGPYSWPPA